MHPVVVQAASVEPNIVRSARRRRLCHQLCRPRRRLQAPVGQRDRPAGAMAPHPPRQLNAVSVTQAVHDRGDLGDVEAPRPDTMPPPPPPGRVSDHLLASQRIRSRPVLDELAHRYDPAPAIVSGDPLRQVTGPQQLPRRLDHRRSAVGLRRAPRVLQDRDGPCETGPGTHASSVLLQPPVGGPPHRCGGRGPTISLKAPNITEACHHRSPPAPRPARCSGNQISVCEPPRYSWRVGLLVSNRLVVGSSGSVGRLELCGRDVAEVGVEPN